MNAQLRSVMLWCLVALPFAAQACEGDSCGLGGPRGAVDDDSQVITRPVAPNGVATLPADGEKILPNETIVLWGLEKSPMAGEVKEVEVKETNTVVLKGVIPFVRFESGKSYISEEYVQTLREVLDRLATKKNVRLHAIGHTDAQRLSPRSKKIYGDNYGLGLDRAKQVVQLFADRLGLDPKKQGFESKGPDEPIKPQSDEANWPLNRRVEVQVWYDEDRSRKEKVEVKGQPECAGSGAATPGLPFRLSVDGVPVDKQDAANGADGQRCTDVALEKGRVQVQYDNLTQPPRLNIASGMRAARPGVVLPFQGYTNYLAWVKRAQVRIYGSKGLWLDPEVFATVELDESLSGNWTPPPILPQQLWYRLRVYDAQGRYDESEALPLDTAGPDTPVPAPAEIASELASAYGGTHLTRHTIPLHGGTVTVNGEAIAADRRVFVMGRAVPVDPAGRFVVQQLVPEGLHSVEVAVLDQNGRGVVHRRDLELAKGDWFYVGMADLTIGQNKTSGPARLVTGDTQHYNDDTYVDGRVAFYAKGKTGAGYTLTASADTGEGPFGDLFTNFNAKDPRAFLRRIDSDKGWTTYGDDSLLVEDAPTRGKFYAKVEDGRSHLLWGNFNERLHGNELVPVDRALYGAQGVYGGEDFTAFGARRLQVEGFAAQPGTAAARDDFRGTGGSLYFLQHQDITVGSEQVRVEVRDKVSGLVLRVNNLVAGQDYELDAMQGRLLLSEPLPSLADDSLLVHAGALSGNPVFLVVGYEYSPGLAALNDMASGGRASYWLNDSLQVGVTGARQDFSGAKQDLKGADITLRRSASTWVKVQGAHSDGAGLTQQRSTDGGFNFNSQSAGGDPAGAGRVEAAFTSNELVGAGDGRGTVYADRRGAGYSAPGELLSSTGEVKRAGGSYVTPLSERTDLGVKYDEVDQALAINKAMETDVTHRLDDHWSLGAGLRGDTLRTLGRGEGDRNDLTVKAEYAQGNDWAAWGFAQDTVSRDDNRAKNGRVGAGGRYRVTDHTSLLGEVSGGDLGPGAKAGVNYAPSDRTDLYLNYQLDSDRPDNGLDSRKGQLVTGAKSRWTDTVSVYTEERYQHGNQPVGLTQAYGTDYTPNDRWSYGVGYETGKLDAQTTGEVKRNAISTRVGYHGGGTRYGGAIEYREDRSAVEQRTVWLMRNNYGQQATADWRAVARLDFAKGDSNRGESYNGDFVEASLGGAYRPELDDRLNALVKYTYLYDLPPPNQVSTATGGFVDYAQRSHVVAADLIYDLTERWSVGGKYAYRVGELRMSRDSSAPWFSSTGQLMILRADWHVVRKWDLLCEARRRDEFTAQDSRTGALAAIYREVGNHFRVGLGYNFSEFSDDLTNFDFHTQGLFINAIGKI